jgi:hypothetical protein
MDHENGSRPCQVDRWWRPVRVPGMAVGLLLVLQLLVGEVGSPTALALTLRDLGSPWADPVISMLALMTLTAEAFLGYLLLVLALRSLAMLPGLTGRLAQRITLAVTPAVARGLVDLLVGGALLVQVTVAVPRASLGHAPSGSHQAVALSAPSRSGESATTGDLAPISLEGARIRLPEDKEEPVEARPTSRRSAAPLPPWLGGGPSKPAPRHRAEASSHTVAAGDTLWDIAAAHLVPADRSTATIHRYWQQLYRANRPVVGADPDLIHPGTHLDVAPFRRDRR